MEMNYMDFIKFLESGKLPTPEPGGSSSAGKLSRQGSERSSDGNLRLNSSFLPDNRATAHTNPPKPPAVVSSNHHISEGTSRQRVWSTDGVAATSYDDNEGGDGGQEHEVVLNINLSNINSDVDLPESIKLHSEAKPKRSNNNDDDDELSSADPSSSTFSVIVHPSNKNSNTALSNPQALWRKREVVKQERAVYYTTMDAEGALQELVERETTQTEILHMECRETGEFAHRETTKYEQIETFNSEVVAETEGAEEYVHLKSLEDEFHYMESTMPKKEEGGEGRHGGEEEQEEHPLEDGDYRGAAGEGGGGGGPRYYYDHDEEQQGGEGGLGAGSPDGRGELPDDAPLEEYGFDLDQFAAASKERTNTVHTPQYCMDPDYEGEGGEGGSPRSPPQHKRGKGGAGGGGAAAGDRENLFGDKVVLDEEYGMHSTSGGSAAATAGSGGGGGGSRRPSGSVVYESKEDLKEVVGLRASASYESLHDID